VWRGQIHYKTNISGKSTATRTVRMLNLNVSSASKNLQDAVEGSSDEDSDGESSTMKKISPRRGRRKATTETPEGGAEENKITSENESPEETKEVKRRGRKKGNFTY
jgi:hypothetical protein